MAALRAEPEKIADKQLMNCAVTGEQRDEGKVKSWTNGAAETESCTDKHTSGSSSVFSLSVQTSSPAFKTELKQPRGPDAPSPALNFVSLSHNNRTELVWSDTEDECDSHSRSCEENKGHKLQQVTNTEDQTVKNNSEDAESTAKKNRPWAQDEEKEFINMSVEMECIEDDDKEEEKIEEMEGEPEDGDERREEAEDRGGGEDEEEEEEECHETDAVAKPKKSSMECRECGKTFTRRETFNLHRHFHTHQDEQASLTCKECGLTFQHRSSLIKHRSEHKLVQHPVLSSQRRRRRRKFKEEMLLECEHCGDRFASVIRYRLHACQQNLEKPYRCPLCRKEFQYRVSINAHMQSHSLDSPYRCLECNKGFKCAVTLHIHQRSHAALKPYECPDCGMVFRHRSFMEDHRRRHTEERPHHCKICGKNFKLGSLLQQHQYLHTGQKPYQCSECGKRFAFAQNMRAHYRQHNKKSVFTSPVTHVTNQNVEYGADLGTTGKENTNHDNLEKPRNCPLCPRLFYKAVDLREHMLVHEAEFEKLNRQTDQVYTCSYCPLKFLDESSLQSHVLTHQVTSLPREVLSVTRPDSIDNMPGGGDWADQTDKKPLKCRECGKTFRYRSVLELHMRIHNKGYQCHICKKSFRFSSYLQQHLIIHSGKKPYKCPDCGKDFAFLQNMKTHQRLHQQKPFRCTQCRKGYSDESQLQRHMLSHSGEKPHKCHLCDKSFGLAYLLRDHLNTHTGERPHRCQECHKSFPWLSSLLVHQKIHARKRQALNQSYSAFAISQRERTRGLGGRGKRNTRWISSWTRMGGDTGRTLTQAPFPGQILQGSVLPNVMRQASVSDADLMEQTHLRSQPSLQSWHTDSQAMPIHLQQQWQIHIKPQLQQQAKWVPDGQPNDIKQQWQTGAHLKPILPKLADPPKTGQQQDNSPSSTPKSSFNADELASAMKTRSSASKTQNSTDEWTIDATQNTKNELPSPSAKENKNDLSDDPMEENDSDATVNSEDELPQRRHSTGTQEGSKALNMQENSVNTEVLQQSQVRIMQPQVQLVLQPSTQMQLLQQPLQQIQQEQLQQQILIQQQQFHQSQLSQQQPGQISSVWDGASQPNQLGTIRIQFGAARFAPGPGSTVWGFQATPVVSQTVINGPIQQGSVRAQQQAPVVSGPQILLNQSSPFISPPLPLRSPLALPGPHTIHTIAGQLPRPPQSIFFTPQGLVSERPVIPQALTSPQLTQRTEPPKPGSQVLFGTDRRFNCMVCGCTLPGELELQMHYMQHAQGDI